MKSLDNIDKILIEVEKEESSKVIREERELKKKQYLEKELHPLLAYYAFHYLRCYTKTINHSKSSKKEFGEWVHPDMVGCDFEIEEWSEEVVELSSTIGNPSIKIYSFELKRKITLANLREVFFQAVSNSSWANESYLVAAEIAIDESLDTEIKRLSTSFGIGVIKLDTTNPDNSEIKYPALTKDNLDWDTVNKLTINPDFRMFLRRISNDLRSREVRKEWYDKILEKDKLESSFKTEF